MKKAKFCRFARTWEETPRYGLLEGAFVLPLLAAQEPGLPALGETAEPLPLESVRLLAPVRPSKVVCVGRNYRDHAAELGNPMPEEPLLFLKPPSAVVGPGEFIELPKDSTRVEHEGELAVVIGRRAKNLSEGDDPLDCVFGYTCLNDVTARDLQRKDVQFTRGKSFDSFCPVGPAIATGLDPLDLLVETRVNGEVRQSARTSVMAFPVPHLIRYVSRVMTLEPGDLIATGTPAGVGPLREGDVVEVEVEGIGVLSNPVRVAGS